MGFTSCIQRRGPTMRLQDDDHFVSGFLPSAHGGSASMLSVVGDEVEFDGGQGDVSPRRRSSSVTPEVTRGLTSPDTFDPRPDNRRTPPPTNPKSKTRPHFLPSCLPWISLPRRSIAFRRLGPIPAIRTLASVLREKSCRNCRCAVNLVMTNRRESVILSGSSEGVWRVDFFVGGRADTGQNISAAY